MNLVPTDRKLTCCHEYGAYSLVTAKRTNEFEATSLFADGLCRKYKPKLDILAWNDLMKYRRQHGLSKIRTCRRIALWRRAISRNSDSVCESCLTTIRQYGPLEYQC